VFDVEAGVCANDMLLYMDACIHGNGIIYSGNDTYTCRMLQYLIAIDSEMSIIIIMTSFFHRHCYLYGRYSII
jgi:hypothetical protein